MDYNNELGNKIRRAEGMLAGLVLKNPEILCDYSINKSMLSEEALFYIGLSERLLEKGVEVIDEINIISEVENNAMLTEVYNEYGGWNTIKELKNIVNEENADSIYNEWGKWCLVKNYSDSGILNLEKHWDKILAMKSGEQVENYIVASLNDIGLKSCITNSSVNVTDLCSGYDKFINEWDKGVSIGTKLGFPILNYTLCGMHKGTLSFLLALSGNGKTSFAIPLYVLPTIENGEKILIIANEQNESDWRQLILSTVMFNRTHHVKMNRQKLLYGGFTKEDRESMRLAMEWLEKYKGNIKFAHLKDYGIENIRKLVNKYSKMGYKNILVDTLKPEDDSSEKAWGQFSETAKELFLLAQKNDVAILCTAQLATNAYGRKYLDINSIGKSKSIAEVAGQILMFRTLQSKEYEKIKVWRQKRDANGKLTQQKEEITLNKDSEYIVLFVAKNRYGSSNVQLVYERDMSFNTYKEIGFTEIEYDGFNSNK